MKPVTCWAQFDLTFHLGSRKSVRTNSSWHGILEITAEIQFTELRADRGGSGEHYRGEALVEPPKDITDLGSAAFHS